MKPITKTPNDMPARLLLALALYVPALDALYQAPVIAPLGYAAVWNLALVLVLAMLPRRGFIIMLAATWLAAPLIISMLGYIALDGVTPSYETIGDTLAETNLRESLSAFHLALHAGNFALWMAGFVCALILATVFAAFNRPLKDDQIGLRQIVLCLCLVPISFGFVIGEILDTEAPKALTNAEDLRMTAFGQITLVAFHSLVDGHFMLGKKGMKEMGSQHEQAHETIHITTPALSVLVIGESMRANGLGPQTADRGEWSKALNDRVRAGLGVWLPPVCAIHDSTAISVPALITGTPPEAITSSDYKQYVAQRRPTGLSRLQSAGYEIGWIASPVQPFFSGPEVFHEHGFSWYKPTGDVTERFSFDGDLLPVAEGFVSPLSTADYQGPPKALVLHLAGSHFDYEDRYPDTLFGPEPAGLSEEALQTLRYERANEYGAKNLVGVAKILDEVKVPAFAVYTSDHGENLISDHNGLLGHVAARTSLAGDVVPALVMWNEAAKNSGLPQKVLAEVAQAPRLAQVDIYHVWMALSGLDGGDTVHPTKEPMVWGAVNAGDKFAPIPCSSLKP